MILLNISDTDGSVEKPECVLHTGSRLNEKVILFTKETLEICKNKKEIRDQTKKKKSKFDNIVLPAVPDDISGYHSMCYRYFCAGVKNPKKDARNVDGLRE